MRIKLVNANTEECKVYNVPDFVNFDILTNTINLSAKQRKLPKAYRGYVSSDEICFYYMPHTYELAKTMMMITGVADV